jgi:glycosyltransferase involved in cell wall biosynthesis
MIKKGLVSIIIPVYNRPNLVREAIMCCLLQSYENIEVIIVDDGSTDQTQLILEELEKKWRKSLVIRVQENSGPGIARQNGTEMAEGEFIQYLDSDDVLLEDKLSLQVDKLSEETNSDICYMISYQADYAYKPPLVIGPMRSSGGKKESLFPQLLNERWWTTSSPLYRRSLIRRMDSWSCLKNEEDWVFDAHAGSLHTKVCWVEQEGSIRRVNISSDHLSRDGYIDKGKLRDRIYAKAVIYSCAKHYGLRSQDKEMKIFSRECFFLARQTAICGMGEETESIFRLAKQSGGRFSFLKPSLVFFQLMGQLLGWNNSARILRRLKGKM